MRVYCSRTFVVGWKVLDSIEKLFKQQGRQTRFVLDNKQKSTTSFDGWSVVVADNSNRKNNNKARQTRNKKKDNNDFFLKYLDFEIF